MTESWTSENSDIDLPGYTCFNYYRKFRHRRAKRNSGGTVIFIKNTIKDGITIVKNNYDTIVWLKLCKTFFHNENDIYLCGVYL